MIDFEITTTPHHHGGTHAVYKMKNGMGASVIPEYDWYEHDMTVTVKKGFYELAVLRLPAANGDDRDEYSLCYCTPVANDVIESLREDEVYDKLMEIANLTQTQCKCRGFLGWEYDNVD